MTCTIKIVGSRKVHQYTTRVHDKLYRIQGCLELTKLREPVATGPLVRKGGASMVNTRPRGMN